jgi:hypothetical protein
MVDHWASRKATMMALPKEHSKEIPTAIPMVLSMALSMANY